MVRPAQDERALYPFPGRLRDSLHEEPESCPGCRRGVVLLSSCIYPEVRLRLYGRGADHTDVSSRPAGLSVPFHSCRAGAFEDHNLLCVGFRSDTPVQRGAGIYPGTGVEVCLLCFLSAAYAFPVVAVQMRWH